ncbi:MAG: four helix bundle protein [Candidatus Pacebacteria bacterium]|nr:four helix bundle protein [Candidatus Paceibacterota bacterium]
MWISYLVHIPNIHKYSLGENINKLFIETIEMSAYASFLSKTEKIPYVKIAVRKLDTLKIMVQIVWEIKAIDDKKYITLSEKLNKTGQMLGGWHNSLLTKENSPTK